MKYAIAAAPGYFRDKTEIVCVHISWSEALVERGFPAKSWAIYEALDDAKPGDILWGDMMPRRLDRTPSELPESPYMVFRYPADVVGQFGDAYRGWFIQRGGKNEAGPFASAREAEAKCQRLTKVWQREWLTG